MSSEQMNAPLPPGEGSNRPSEGASPEGPRAVAEDIAIRVQNLSKCYQIYDAPRDRLKQSIVPRLQRLARRAPRNYFHEFWALKDVSFQVKKGETVGIIGRNGSGKSTLLQLICGTLTPTSGNIEVNGRVAALLELGSGFNPEFTGRENVYMNGAVLGLSKREVDERFADIAAFADIGEFIEQPVKIYSSGMMVRLAFAVIAHVDADILVVDEALSVGDVFFSQKCMRFFERFQSAGGTVLFVSHDTAAVMNLCRHAILLVQGAVRQAGPADVICKTYLEQLYAERVLNVPAAAGDDFFRGQQPSIASDQLLEFLVPEQKPNQIIVSPFNASAASFGLSGAKILDAGFFDADGRRLSELWSGAAVRFSIMLTSEKHIRFPAVGLALKDRLGQAVFTESTTWAFDGQYGEGKLEFFPGDIVRVDFDHKVPILFEGDYAITVAVAEGYGHDHVQHHYIHEALILRSTGRRLVHGITGFADLQVAIRISRTTATSMPTSLSLETTVQ
jgi:lipopolysaccharide transport system ATP-binding protein